MQTVTVYEPRVDIKHDSAKAHVKLMGGRRVTEQIQTADSYSSSQCLFNFSPPSQDVIVDRNMKLRCYLEFKADADFDLGVNDGPRQFPLASIMDSLQVSVNNESISSNVSDSIHALLCYNNDAKKRSGIWSTTPAMGDSYQQLSDWSVYGSARNPLAQYGENSAETSRGAFELEIVNSTTVRVVFSEHLFISPFLQGQDEEGFTHIDQLSVAIRWASELSKAWSHSSLGNAITNIDVSFYQAPEMLVTYITPDLTQPIPESVVYPYQKLQQYIRQVPSVPAGSQTLVITDSIKLSQVPRKMYLFARRSRGTTTFETADAFARITNIRLNWNNQASLLSSATEQDLYDISVSNGLNVSFPAWKKHKGSVMCLEFGKDVGLDGEFESPGSLGQYTFQIECTIENVSAAAEVFEFYTLLVQEGSFIVADNVGRATLGIGASTDSGLSLDYSSHQALHGGGFFSSLKGIVNTIAKGVEAVAKPLSTVHPAFGAVGQIASGARELTGGSRVGGRLSTGRRR